MLVNIPNYGAEHNVLCLESQLHVKLKLEDCFSPEFRVSLGNIDSIMLSLKGEKERESTCFCFILKQLWNFSLYFSFSKDFLRFKANLG